MWRVTAVNKGAGIATGVELAKWEHLTRTRLNIESTRGQHESITFMLEPSQEALMRANDPMQMKKSYEVELAWWQSPQFRKLRTKSISMPNRFAADVWLGF